MNVTGTLRILVLISGIAFSSLRAGCQETLSVPGSGNGQGTEADERLRVALEQEPWTHRARTEIESAAKNGNPGAKLALAGLYSQGREVSRDPSRASALIREAAEAGLPSACYLIGAKFLDDDSAPPGTAIVGDYQSASEWLEKAASKGHVEAAHQLGELYYYGKLSYDFHLAAKWLRMAAEAGDVKAAALLPYLYFCNHPGFARDRAEGLRWM
ncbi:MAG TPA: tetratricopeptide repeat protein, partial [Candidatus Limnocylindrales bacterium]|nr:tetratricopeptide repeat protein [Candidatus Limnocylindrales bacterium]